MAISSSNPAAQGQLRRALGLTHLVLYGLGVTIGAGIFVLIGSTVGRAGVHAPVAFALAALAMAFSACSFAELSARYPVSAGEAAYVRLGLRSRSLSLFTGLLVITAGTVSAAAISIGASGYLLALLSIPETVLILALIAAMGAVASWGVLESVTFAAVLSALEIVALCIVIAAGFSAQPTLLQDAVATLATLELTGLGGIVAASLLAFFAFTGFEDLVNLAEEAKQPERTMPMAIFLTLVIVTVMYVLVAYVAIFSGPIEELADSRAPLGLVFERTTGMSPLTITLIAVIATLNGVIVQIVMASRVIYGLACQGQLPALLSVVNRRTKTPLRATVLVTGLVALLAVAAPLESLAEITSALALTVFSLVNLALIRLKFRRDVEPPSSETFVIPVFIPVLGLLASVLLLGANLVERFG